MQLSYFQKKGSQFYPFSRTFDNDAKSSITVHAPAVFGDEALWFAANRITGRNLAIAGVVQSVLGAIALALSLPEGVLGAAVVAVALLGALHSLWFTCELAYALDSGEGSSEAALEAAETVRRARALALAA